MYLQCNTIQRDWFSYISVLKTHIHEGMFATLLNDLWQSNTIFSLKRVLESAQHCGQKETPSTCWSHPTSSSQVALIRGHPTGCCSPLTWHGFPRTSSTGQRECRPSNLRLSPHQWSTHYCSSEAVLENPRVQLDASVHLSLSCSLHPTAQP